MAGIKVYFVVFNMILKSEEGKLCPKICLTCNLFLVLRKLVLLAFAGSIGMTFVILGCALPQYEVWWPFFVVLFYVLAPIPTLIARRYTEDSTSSSNPCLELAIFLTMGFVVSSFALPIVLARSPAENPVIQWVCGEVILYCTYKTRFSITGRERFVSRNLLIKEISMNSNISEDDISMIDITDLPTSTDRQDHAQSSSSRFLSPDETDIVECLDSLIPYATCHLRRTTDISFQDHAETIARRLQSSNQLMQDDLTSEQLRKDMLKGLPQCLAIRKLVKSKLHIKVQEKSKKKSISYWKWLKYKISFTFRKTHIMIQDIEHIMELWYHNIKSIEGQFGSGVAVYFKFLRWIILLNIIFAIMSIFFIVLPQSLDQVYSSSSIDVLDFITGSGFFENTIMYYGFYNNGTVTKMFNSTYSIPTAYFMTLFCAYIFTFIVLSIKVILSYRKHYIEIRGNVQHFYCNKVFCGWDFAISSTKAATLQSISICRELQEHIAEAEKHLQYNCFISFYVVFTRVIISIITVVMICGTGGVLWVLLHTREIDKSKTTSLMIVPVVITIIMNLFSIIISFLAKMEKYSSKRTEVGHSYIWEYVVDGVLELQRDSDFWLLISELARPSVGAVILIAMCVGVYWLRAKAQANKDMLKILHEMLVLHARDKQFLLKGFIKITSAGKLYRRSDVNRLSCHLTDQEKNPILSNKRD
ncbi:hypothetical protein KPH14_007683 [Odynerus spinipes]|uniref:Uncharacterized protein n=1 Tax=Odynerus spinipes TaxID=1348599 RepID=A0AAD9RJZ4_9HYME|nr:hypothetical protein KPH14_007683 [Odynerus spinipes]